MRYILAAAVAAGISTGAAQAITVDLKYIVESQVTAFNYFDPYDWSPLATPYNGPLVGDIELKTLYLLILDTDESSGEIPYFRSARYSQFDPVDGSAIYDIDPASDEAILFDLSEVGGGSVMEKLVINHDTGAFVLLTYDVLSWTVEGLPDIAIVPLPASLPLLALGMGAFAVMRRKRAPCLLPEECEPVARAA